MAAYSMTATQLTIAGQDYTSDARSVSINISVDQLDTTNFGSAGWRTMIGGLKSGELTVTFNDDFADNGLDEDIFALLGSTAAITCKPTGSAVSTSNPEFQFSVLVNNWNFGGEVGALAQKSVTWPITAAVVRDVTP